jgi:hypothetical protein
LIAAICRLCRDIHFFTFFSFLQLNITLMRLPVWAGLPDFSFTMYQNGEKYTKWAQNYQTSIIIPNGGEIYHTEVKYTKWPQNYQTSTIIPNSGEIYQTSVEIYQKSVEIYQTDWKYTNFFNSRLSKTHPNLDFLVQKCSIWQPCVRGKKAMQHPACENDYKWQ